MIKLDIGIKDEEAKNTLTYYSRDGHEFRGYVDWKNITNNIDTSTIVNPFFFIKCSLYNFTIPPYRYVFSHLEVYHISIQE